MGMKNNDLENDELLAESVKMRDFINQIKSPNAYFGSDVYLEVVNYTEQYCKATVFDKFTIWVRYGITLFKMQELIQFLRICEAG